MKHATRERAVTVQIYDGVYQLRGVDPQHIAQLGSMVDGKMRAVSAHGATVDSLRVAVLAALNIADELMDLRERHRSLIASLDSAENHTRSRATSLSKMLDGAIAGDYLDRIAG